MLNLVLFVLEYETVKSFSINKYKYAILFIFILFTILLYFTLIDLKRVEEEGDYFFVTNYYHTYKYSKQDIASIKSANYGIMNVITITMKSKTKFGHKIRYIGKSETVQELES